MNMLSYDFMQRALIAAVIVGVIAPLIGTYLVQRRLALLGDGMGHVALTGVGIAFLLDTAPIATAMVVAAIGAVIIEVIRARSRTAGDLALALIFYGGIAGGVLFASLAGGRGTAALTQYLFGSLTTVSASDLVGLALLALIVLVVLVVFGREMFALSLDVDTARVQGIRTTGMSTLLTVLAAVAVVVGMRTVGLLLVSAIMIVPVAAAQQLTRSFMSTMALAAVLGVIAATVGLTSSFYLAVPPGPTIVFAALALFPIAALIAVPIRKRRRLEHP